MLTKTDLKQISDVINNNLKPLKDDIKVMKSHNLRIEMNTIDIKQKFEKNLFTWKSELFTKIDKVIKELEIIRSDQITKIATDISQNDKINNHEKRVKRVEKHLDLPEIPYVTT